MSPGHHESQASAYGHDTWMNMGGGYSHAGPSPTLSPMPDFHGFDFNQQHQPQAPMPIEPSYSIPRPPPYSAGVPQMPPPLIMPHNGVWPSMIASQSQQGTYQPPTLLPALPPQTPISASTASDATPTSAKTSTSRRKLTDEERRQMCLEAEQNPTMKQTQIGAKFNVERSTVSKILRQKERYINPPPKEEVISPGKKSKAKLPDFEKTLTNWVKNQQRRGLAVTDEDLRKQARKFSFSRSDQALLSSPSWLEKVKQKNGLMTSESTPTQNSGVENVNSSATSYDETPNNASPTSSNGLVSPPISATDDNSRLGLKEEQSLEYFDFDEKDFSHSPSIQPGSTIDLENALAGPIMSPLSPDPMPVEATELPDIEFEEEDLTVALASGRQRSQTISYTSNSGARPSSSSNRMAALPSRSLTASLDSRPMSMVVDPRQMMKRHKSVPDIHDAEPVRFSSMQPPPLPKSTDVSPISHPGSPVAEDDNIKALHAIKKLLQQHPGVADPDDYLAIGKLMEKLKLLRSPTSTPVLPGGMHSVETLESPRINRKRTITGIST
ncbi:hypothetical protein DV736_g521, partial [Chaetothyriales sp. CBS 134916]